MGLLVVAVSVVVGARVLASADDTVAVWAARDDLVAGTTASPDDVEAVQVRFRDADRLGSYLPADRAWDPELVLLRDVAAGELVPSTAAGEEREVAVRLLPVAVEPSQVPPGVRPGSVVDVWAAGVDVVTGQGDGAATGGVGAAPSSPGSGASPGTGAGALLVLEGVRVVEAPDPSSQVGSIAERQLVLEVPEDQLEAIPAALEALAAGAVTVAQRG